MLDKTGKSQLKFVAGVVRYEGCVIFQLDKAPTKQNEHDDHRDLGKHNDHVGPGGFLNANHQQHRYGDYNQHRRQIEHAVDDRSIRHFLRVERSY